jgi:formate hydrogenlyase subunit 3/multisubunit Na+/H+ antiporter MnhD subunit
MMMNAILFLIILFLSLPVFIIPKYLKYYYILFLLIGAIIITSVWCFGVLTGSNQILDIRLDLPVVQRPFILTIDRLSAFFIIVINITVFTGFLYARGYLQPYYQSKNALRFSIHYFSYLWLYLSMIMVVMIRDGLSFLIV